MIEYFKFHIARILTDNFLMLLFIIICLSVFGVVFTKIYIKPVFEEIKKKRISIKNKKEKIQESISKY